MSDLIERQAAIDAVISLCDDCDSDYCGSCRVNYLGGKDARKALEDLPSAQPKSGQWVKHDTYYDCSRCSCIAPCTETADSIIWKLSDFCPDCGARMQNTGRIIEMLSTQPETHGERTETHACDCISRQATITEIMADLKDRSLHDDPDTPEDYAEGYDEGIRNAAAIVHQMPSAQKWTPCSDPSDLPKDERLWITREIYGARIVYDVVWDMTEWSDSVSGVVAYMPYWEPEPYTER